MDGKFLNGTATNAPYSTGTEPPKTRAPLGATDCHHHIFDPRYPKVRGEMKTPATVSDYKEFKKRLGLSRSVVVAPSSYGDDNRALLDALSELGLDAARGVAIVNPDVSDTELDRLHEAGVRGLRFYFAKGRVPTVAEMQNVASKIAGRGWHIQLVGARQEELYPEWESVIAELPCSVVIDHFGYIPLPEGVNSITASVIRRLLDNGKTYVKLSGVYIQSKVGFPSYSDLDNVGRMLINHSPERMLWGSDWPHTSVGDQRPDGAMLFDQLTLWEPDEARRKQILVDNPQRVYWGE